MLILPTLSQIHQEELLLLAKEAKNNVKRIILFWTRHEYDLVDDDYHLCIGKNGEIYQTCTGLLDKKPSLLGVKDHKATIAIALCAGFEAQNASKGRFTPGSNPPTWQQINCLVWLLAYLCFQLPISIRFDTVLTHGEFTLQHREGIGTNFFWLQDLDDPKRFRFGGAMLRELAEEKRKKYVMEDLPLHLRQKREETENGYH